MNQVLDAGVIPGREAAVMFNEVSNGWSLLQPLEIRSMPWRHVVTHRLQERACAWVVMGYVEARVQCIQQRGLGGAASMQGNRVLFKPFIDDARFRPATEKRANPVIEDLVTAPLLHAEQHRGHRIDRGCDHLEVLPDMLVIRCLILHAKSGQGWECSRAGGLDLGHRVCRFGAGHDLEIFTNIAVTECHKALIHRRLVAQPHAHFDVGQLPAQAGIQLRARWCQAAVYVGAKPAHVGLAIAKRKVGSHTK